jgi:hypothetical protein
MVKNIFKMWNRNTSFTTVHLTVPLDTLVFTTRVSTVAADAAGLRRAVHTVDFPAHHSSPKKTFTVKKCLRGKYREMIHKTNTKLNHVLVH